MICGVVLFGVPAFAFWLQKRFAEKSSRAANYLARHDASTELLNRSAFVAEAGKLASENRICHAAYVDLDRFKLVNETYGHKVGDAFLCHVAHLLGEKCGPHSVIARLGGDEFAFVLMRELDEDPQGTVDRLRAAAARGRSRSTTSRSLPRGALASRNRNRGIRSISFCDVPISRSTSPSPGAQSRGGPQ